MSTENRNIEISTPRRGRPPLWAHSPSTLAPALRGEFRTLVLSPYGYRASDIVHHFAERGFPMRPDTVRKAMRRLRREAGLRGTGGRSSSDAPAVTRPDVVSGVEIEIKITSRDAASVKRVCDALLAAFDASGGSD